VATTTTTSFTITPLNGFSGPVNLVCGVQPASYTYGILPQCSVPASVNVSAGNLANVNVKVTIDPLSEVGFYVMTVGAIDAGSGKVGIDNTIDLLLTSGPAFTLAHQADITVAAGATSGNTAAISVTPVNGFTGTINFTCAVNPNFLSAVKLPSCSLAPTSVTVTASSVPGSTLTVTTAAPTTGAVVPGVRPSRLPGWTVLAIALLFGIRGKRRAWMRILGLLVVLLWIAAPGCGGGSGSGGGGGGGGGTTPGSYTVVVTGTASGQVTAQTKVTLTVK
jgi:hypothetical protein